MDQPIRSGKGMSTAVVTPSDQPLVERVTRAEQSLAFYVAIVGHQPNVIPPNAVASPPRDAMRLIRAIPRSRPHLPHLAELHLPNPWPSAARRMQWAGWVREISRRARERLAEARMRIAS